MFGQRLLEINLSIFQVIKFLVSTGHSRVCLRNYLEIITIFAANFHSLLALFNTFIKFSLLKVNSSLVVEKRHVGGIQTDCLVVATQGFFEITFLIKFVAFILRLKSLSNLVKS